MRPVGAGAVAPATGTANSSQTTARDPAKDPVVDVGSVRLVNGQVAFSDRFIQPNYSAELSALNGTLEHFEELKATARLFDISGVTSSADALTQLEEELNGKVDLAILCPITSQVKGYPFEVRVPGDLDVDGWNVYASVDAHRRSRLASSDRSFLSSPDVLTALGTQIYGHVEVPRSNTQG